MTNEGLATCSGKPKHVWLQAPAGWIYTTIRNAMIPKSNEPLSDYSTTTTVACKHVNRNRAVSWWMELWPVGGVNLRSSSRNPGCRPAPPCILAPIRHRYHFRHGGRAPLLVPLATFNVELNNTQAPTFAKTHGAVTFNTSSSSGFRSQLHRADWPTAARRTSAGDTKLSPPAVCFLLVLPTRLHACTPARLPACPLHVQYRHHHQSALLAVDLPVDWQTSFTSTAPRSRSSDSGHLAEYRNGGVD
ncbi:uncharacterized protein J3D65DRAFT_385831 [Phyllosticta citribraziliensis]|uniref:Uncharacterized protein n=1 Tax=Phyllosticta citribraziliensis TaxID=989973 RepID=A0ABR1LQQ4_9PEZI